MKILVVGAGIAGLAIGWRLAQAGATVEIVERGLPGRAASWAAAGMLAPGAELSTDDDALSHFARAARAAWPAFARELEEASGWDIGFSVPGSLIVAQTEARAASLKRHAAMLGESGTRSEWLTRDNLLAREPLLSRNLHGALHVPGDAQVDNRVLGDALGAALARLSVPLQQFRREHLLAQSMIDNGLYDEGDLVTIAPALNFHVQDAAEAYQAQLREPEDSKIRFVNLTLEDVIEVIRLSDPAHAEALHHRYCDFWLVDGELELNAPTFGLARPRTRQRRKPANAG